MHELLRVPRGCPTYGRGATEPPACGGRRSWGRGSAAGGPAHFPPHSRALNIQRLGSPGVLA